MGLLQEKLAKYDLPQKFMAQGVYPYFREIKRFVPNAVSNRLLI